MITLNIKILLQLKKYGLLNYVTSIKWLSELNERQITNFLSLNIPPEQIMFEHVHLINPDLLNTQDYLQKIKAFMSIQNQLRLYSSFVNLFGKSFLNSPYFYQDITILDKAPNVKTILKFIGNPNFVNSPYHEEDLQLFLSVPNEALNLILEESLIEVMTNQNSIMSPYHLEDLKTILKYSTSALQAKQSYPFSGINFLAVHPVSLKDPYHLENMKILAQNQDIGKYLYAVMTSLYGIDSDYYRKIITEMLATKQDVHKVYLLCCYVIGKDNTNVLQYLSGENSELVLGPQYYDLFNEMKQKLEEGNEDISLKRKKDE